MLTPNLYPDTLYKKFSFSGKKEDYKFLNIIGKGGFSVVYEAEYHLHSIKVAIKRVQKQAEDFNKKIYNEIAIQSELNHENIVKLYTVFEDKNYIYIVLELCSNGSLSQVKDSKKHIFNENDVKLFIKQITEGLRYLHSKHIAHRDIKLANILLTKNKKIKIADFGLATRLLDQDDRHITICGTPNYISPEVISRQPHGLEVDLWGLGCLLYTLLVGKPPFETDCETVKCTLHRVIHNDYYMPPELSSDAKNLISHLLQKNPLDRMNIDEILDHPFINNNKISLYHNWISSDSGIDSITATAVNISPKFQFLNNEQFSNYSNGYFSFKNSESLKHSRSQSKIKSSLQHSQFSPEEIIKTISSSSKLSECHNEVQFFNEKHTDDSRHYMDNIKINESYSFFCGNEVVNHTDCNSKICSYNVKSHSSRNYYFTGENNDLTKYNRVPLRANEKFERSDKKKKSEFNNCVKVTSFNTERLRPTRCKCKNIILSLLENGEVCLEFLRTTSKRKEIVVEICKISKDGLKMYIYYPNKEHEITSSDYSSILSLKKADATFNCEKLSKENYKKYNYASKFVEMIQSRTPKIILYTSKAKCVLMENKPNADFEVTFYEGPKITKSRKGIKLIDNGKVVYVLDDICQENLNISFKHHYNYFKESYNYCLLIEKTLTSVNDSGLEAVFRIFPATLGKKPTIKEKNVVSNDFSGSSNIFPSTKYNDT